MGYAEENRSLYAVVAADTAPSTEVVVRWMRQALERVVLPSVAEPNYTLGMDVTLLGEDLSRKDRPGRIDVIWDRIPRDELLEGIAISGWSEERAARHEYLEAQVLDVHAGFPISRRRLDGTTGQRETTIALSVPRRSLKGCHVDADLQHRTIEWLLGAFGDLEGTTGYVTIDFVMAGPGAYSPYELAAMFPPGERNFHRHLWGYYWGNLLNADHVKLLGGPDVIQQAPVAAVRPVGDGGFYLQLTDDINDIDLDRLHQLRQFLQPVLPEGSQPLEEYRGRPPYVL